MEKHPFEILLIPFTFVKFVFNSKFYAKIINGLRAHSCPFLSTYVLCDTVSTAEYSLSKEFEHTSFRMQVRCLSAVRQQSVLL